MSSERDSRTPSLLGVALPADPKEAGDHLLKLSQQSDVPPFWVAAPRRGLHLSDHRPAGTRPSPHVAMVLVTKDMLAKGQVDIRYHDGLTVRLLLTDLASGLIVLPGDICQRWVLAEAGEKDLVGRVHT